MFCHFFFCYLQRCREEDPSLTIRYKPKKSERVEKPDRRDQEERKHKKNREKERYKQFEDANFQESNFPKKPTKRCGACSGCLRLENCGKCDNCQHLKIYGPSVRLKIRCIQRTCKTVGQKNLIKPKTSAHSGSKPSKKRKRDSSNERIDYLELPPKHCYGPSCTKQSRQGSKYCSDECGIRLATNRIYHILPQRLNEWSLTPCIAEQNNRHALDNIRRQQYEVKRILHELDKKHAEIDRIVERARNATIDPNSDIDDAEDIESSMYCITCGHEVNTRTAVKHMEKCFNKVSKLIQI